MKRKKIIALLLATSMAVAGCGAEPASQDNTQQQTENVQSDKELEESTESTENSVSAENMVQITEETVEDTITAQDGTPVMEYICTIPVITITGNEQATKAMKADVEAVKENFLEEAGRNGETAREYYEGITDQEEKESFYAYSNFASYYVSYQNDKIISIVYQNYSYLGGAHGDSVQITANYSLETGERLTFDSFFADRESAMADIKAQVQKQCESSYYSQRLFPEYEEYLDDVLVEDYWYFGKSGMRFISNEYMLGSYAAGSFEFVIPYSDMPETRQEFITQDVYLYPVLYGNATQADLDGDKSQEEICFNIISPEPEIEVDEDGQEYAVCGETTCSLTVDGKEYADILREQANYYVESPNCYYYLVDLDESDSYVELAVVDYGNNDYAVTIFLRYDKGELTYLGSIHDVLESDSCKLFGKGKLSAREHSNLLQTIDYIYDYQLVDGKIKEQPKDWYTIENDHISEEYQTHKILKDVTVYTENNTDSHTRTLTPQDGAVIFVASDNSEWVQLKTEDGSIYYLHMTGMTEIDSAGVTEDAMEIFENLFLAG